MRKILYYLYVCFSIIVASYCSSVSITNEVNLIITQATIPVVYTIIVILLGSRLLKNNEPSLVVLWLTYISTLRYLITPLSWYIGGMRPLMHAENTTASILLTLYEMIVVFLILYYAVPRKWENGIFHKLNMDSTSNVGTVFIIIFLAFAIIKYPDYITRLSSATIEEMEEITIESSLRGMFNLGYISGWIAVYCCVISIHKKMRPKGVWSAILISILFVWIIALGTGGHFSRTSFLNHGLIILSIVVCLYSQYSKRIITLTVPILLIVMLLGTMARFELSSDTALDTLFGYDSMNAYYAGVENINVALAMDYSRFRLSTLINDFIASVPFLATRIGIDFTDRTPYIFNETFFAGRYLSVSRICPLIGQGVAYFTAAFSPIFDIFFTMCCLKFEHKIRSSENMLEYYAFFLLTIFTCGFLGSNINTMMNGWFNRVLPLMVVVLMNKKLKFSFNRKAY